jgi:hypothetical protein
MQGIDNNTAFPASLAVPFETEAALLCPTQFAGQPAQDV